MRPLPLSLLLVTTSTLAACSAPSPDDGAETTSAAQTAQQDGIEFHADGEVSADALRKDDDIVLYYDTKRIAGCGVLGQAGPPNTFAEVSYRVNGGPIANVPLGTQWFGGPESTAARAVLPAPGQAGQIEMWFHAWNAEGCHSWDSAFGRNYRFDVHVPTIGAIDFTAPRGRVPTPGALPSGGFVKVTYDGARVPGCATTNGEGEHFVSMWYRFDFHGGWASRTQNVFTQGSAFQTIAVPPGSHHLELWFEAVAGGGCHDYDSRDGLNYVFGLH